LFSPHLLSKRKVRETSKFTSLGFKPLASEKYIKIYKPFTIKFGYRFGYQKGTVSVQNFKNRINKNSYIDSFLERSVNAYSLVEEIRWALDGKNSWYLN
jgi:hypothetical protein